jgi:hypothetical protein
MTPHAEHTCKSCHHQFRGHYCNVCGEKVILPKDRSFKAVVRDVKETFSMNNRFFRTLRLIMVSPGFVSREYASGRRVGYYRPLQLFFVLNLIYFLFPVLQLFNASLRTQMYYLIHSAWIRPQVVEHVVREGMSLEGFTLLYNEKSIALAKLLIIVFVALASLPLSLIFHKRNRYFNDHLTLSVELAVFNLLVNAVLLTGLLLGVHALFKWGNNDWQSYLNETTLSAIFIGTNLYFMYRAAGTFYGQKGVLRILKSVLGIVGLFAALEAYRLLLFYVTFWSL